MTKSFKLYLFIIVISLLPLVDMFINPDLPHTSDGAMHLARFAAYYKEFISGQFPVRWASQFNFGYGTPIFNFFHPLPYLIGIPLIAIGFNLVNVLKISFVLTYLLAGIFMLMFAISYFRDEKKALLVAVMYQFAPFRLVDMSTRGSLGSLYSYAILPLIFWAVTKFLEEKKYSYFTLIAISAALLSMSHNIIGFVYFGLVFAYILFSDIDFKNKALIWISMLWGLGIAAFFLIPAILEHKFTYGYLHTKNLFYEHFAALYKFFLPNIVNSPWLRQAEVSVQIGLFHVFSLFAAIYFWFKNNAKTRERKMTGFLLFITIVTLIFMQPVTMTIWENVSIIRQFQFPWRLMSVIIFTTAMLSTQIIKFKIFNNKYIYLTLIIFTVISTIYYWTPYQGYMKAPQDFYWNYPKSTNYFGEINSIWMAGEPLDFPKNKFGIISGKGKIINYTVNPEIHELKVSTDNDSKIVDRTQFYPGWKVFIDGTETPIEFQDENYRGLITFSVPKGEHQILIKYGQDRLQILSNTISIISILGITILYFFQKKFRLI